MDDAERFEQEKAGLKHCPECGGELEHHPLNTNMVSCFVHGDFVIMWFARSLIVQWQPFRSKGQS